MKYPAGGGRLHCVGERSCRPRRFGGDEITSGWPSGCAGDCSAGHARLAPFIFKLHSLSPRHLVRPRVVFCILGWNIACIVLLLKRRGRRGSVWHWRLHGDNSFRFDPGDPGSRQGSEFQGRLWKVLLLKLVDIFGLVVKEGVEPESIDV